MIGGYFGCVVVVVVIVVVIAWRTEHYYGTCRNTLHFFASFAASRAKSLSIGAAAVVVTEWESEYNGEEAPEPRALNLTRCYSSAEADPANGRWRSCERGIEASPVGFHTTNSLFSFLRK